MASRATACFQLAVLRVSNLRVLFVLLLLLLLLQVVYGRWRKWEKRFVKTEGGSLSLAEARQVLHDGQALQQQLEIGAWLRPLSVYVEQCAAFTDRARSLLDRAAAAAVAAAAVRVGWAVGSLDGFRRKGTLLPEDLMHVLELQTHRKQAEPTAAASASAANRDAAPERRRAPYEQLVELIAIHGELQPGPYASFVLAAAATVADLARRIRICCCCCEFVA